MESGAERNRRYRNGIGELRVENGTALDAVVLLIDGDTRTSVRAMFVQADDVGTFTRVPAGHYRVAYELGRSIDSADWEFCDVRALGQFDDRLNFVTSDADGVYSRTVYRLTLQPVTGGNATTTPIDKNQFVIPAAK